MIKRTIILTKQQEEAIRYYLNGEIPLSKVAEYFGVKKPKNSQSAVNIIVQVLRVWYQEGRITIK